MRHLFSLLLFIAGVVHVRTVAASPHELGTDGVLPYDWSHASPASVRYRVTVNGRPVFVGDFWREHFAHFAFSGKAEVEVIFLQGNVDPALTALSPKRMNVPFAIEGNRIRFTLEKPKQYVLRVNTPQKPSVELDYLFLFAEAPETEVPVPESPGVIDVVAAGIDATGRTDVTAALSALIAKAAPAQTLYFRRGTYSIENLVVRRGDIAFYLEPGAFLHAQLPGNKKDRRYGLTFLEAPNVRLRGRGLIEAHGYALTVEKCRGAVLEDVMVRSDALGKAGVTPTGNEDGGRGLMLRLSDGYRLTNLKILTIMDQEAGKGKDGMNLSSSSDGLVERCFTMSGDDCYTIKGHHDAQEWLAVDLGRRVPLGRVAVRWGDGYLPRFAVDVSDDGAAWRQAATGRCTGERSQSLGIDVSARHVRLRSQERAENYSTGDLVREFEVFARDEAKVNLALRRPVTVSPHGAAWQGHEKEKAVDGDATTSWANEYRSRRVHFRDNVALVTANAIKIGTGSDYAGENIHWERHDVIDSGFLNPTGESGGGMMNFSHYRYKYVPREMAMTGIRVTDTRFEDTVGLVEVGWHFWRTNTTHYFTTKLEAEFENVTFDRVYAGKSLFQVLADPRSSEIRMRFVNLRVAGRLIGGFADLEAAGVKLDLRGLNGDDRIEFIVRP